MIITFLGTGTSQGIPVIACDCEVCQSLDFQDKRLRTSVHVQTEDASVIIDTGPDFRQQVLRENIRDLDAVLFTHAHKDHTAGLDDIRGFNFHLKKDIPVYGRQEVLDQLRREFSYIFSENPYPGIPRVQTEVIDGPDIMINSTRVEAFEVMHLKLPVYGFKIGGFTYITDANYIPPEVQELVKGSEVLVLNALQIDKHISHFNLDEALEMVEKLEPKQAYFTHISHKMGMHRKVSASLPENVALAHDGLKIEI